MNLRESTTVITVSTKSQRWPRMSSAASAFLIGSLLLPPGAYAENAPSRDRVSFYFAAHEDDWQLFMNPSAFLDVTDPKTKAVFIHVTAGDAGGGMGNVGRKHPYFLARENGAEFAIRFMADSAAHPSSKSVSSMQFGGHLIYGATYKNTAAYFLRLPDGNPEGSGYQGTGFQSLARLANGDIKELSAIDGSTSYRGWTDLVSTVRAILDYERGDAPAMQLNVAESNESINPGDHSDHRMTARAALEAAKDLACARRVHYVDYASARLPENLVGQQRDMESSVLAVTAAGILALDHGSIWHPYYRSYLGRNYFRAEEGVGPCRAPVAAALHAVAGRLPNPPAKR